MVKFSILAGEIKIYFSGENIYFFLNFNYKNF